MQKTRAATLPPEGTPVQHMPQPPAALADAPLPPQTPLTGDAERAPVHPMEAEHERVASVHAHFLRLQQQVHTDFLSHRQRLLEGLEQALASAPALAPPSNARTEEAPQEAEDPRGNSRTRYRLERLVPGFPRGPCGAFAGLARSGGPSRIRCP